MIRGLRYLAKAFFSIGVSYKNCGICSEVFGWHRIFVIHVEEGNRLKRTTFGKAMG
jgi:hypothetical protein